LFAFVGVKCHNNFVTRGFI